MVEPPVSPPSAHPGTRPRYVQVAVNAGHPTRQTFTYRVPLGRAALPGEVVHVPWGVRTLQGVITEGPTDLPGYDGDVRDLEPPVHGAPRIDATRLALGAWVQETYLAPAWETYALLLPPGAGERPRTDVQRAPGAPAEPAALSARQQAIFVLLSDIPRPLDELREAAGARGFEQALAALVARGLAQRRYTLERPRGRARIAETVLLAVAPDVARAWATRLEGRRSSRRGRALRALIAAGAPLPFERLAREARGAPAVETLLDAGVLARLGDAEDRVRLALDDATVRQQLRVLSRSQAQLAAVAIVERLAASPEDALAVAQLPALAGPAAREGVQVLLEAGIARIQEVLDRRDPLRTLGVVARQPAELVGEQGAAAASVCAAIDRADGAQVLLYGVTGSGKTEVYLEALAHAAAQGKRGIVLVPEIALTPQTVRRFAERFPGEVGVLHSGLTLGEAYDEWHRIARGAYRVVIGSRSAIFAPQPDLGLIVLDEAHEWTYKQTDPAPRYDSRAVAQRLGELTGAAVVYGTATPDAERWFAAERGAIARVDLPRRVRPVRQPDGSMRLWPAGVLPPVEIVDMRGATSLFSHQLVEALAETLDRDEQTILFINRRGFAGHLLCAGGHSPTCPSCDVALALHDPPGRLVCHLCGRPRPVPPHCTECHRPLRPARAGTQRVEQEVHTLFPTARVVRWDRDTARTADQHEAVLAQFQRHEADVLVGTQMVAKGLDLPLVTLVGVVLADYALWSGDPRGRERTFQLLEQVAGRAGRAELDGRVIIQTLRPDDPAIVAAAAHDVDRFFEAELPWRAQHGYPPFRRLARLLFAHLHPDYAREEAERLAREIRVAAAGLPDVEVLGPVPPAVARLRGRHRWQVIVKAPDPAAVLRGLDLPPGWAVDIDPVALA